MIDDLDGAVKSSGLTPAIIVGGEVVGVVDVVTIYEEREERRRMAGKRGDIVRWGGMWEM